MVRFVSSLSFLLTVVVCKGEQTVVEQQQQQQQQTCQKSESEINGECMASEQHKQESSVVVIKEFLSAEACRKYREVVDFSDLSSSNDDTDLLLVEVPVKDEHANKLIQTFAEIENRSDDHVMTLQDIPGYENPEKDFKVRHSIFMESGKLHQDYYKAGSDSQTLVKGNVAFVFLNSNPNATFYHPGSSEPIPAEEGTLLVFKGDEWHKTIVDSGYVHLFGPLDTTKLSSVGTAAASPTATPTDPPVTDPPTDRPTDPPTDPPAPDPKCGFFDLICKKKKLLCFLFGTYCEQ